MSSETDIFNSALRLVGQTAITSRADGSTNANIIDDIYDDLLDDCLRYNMWNFATKRVQLAQTVITPAYEYDYAYALPADWIRTVSAHNNDAGYGVVDHKEEILGGQRVISASADQLYLRYVARITDPNLWSADFRRAVILAIGRDLAIPIASSNKLKDELNNEFVKTMNRARSSDSMGGTAEMRPRGSWVNRRGNSRNGGFLND